MSERHTMVLRWEGDASLEERLVECAQEHHAEVNRSENGGLACLALTLEASKNCVMLWTVFLLLFPTSKNRLCEVVPWEAIRC